VRIHEELRVLFSVHVRLVADRREMKATAMEIVNVYLLFR